MFDREVKLIEQKIESSHLRPYPIDCYRNFIMASSLERNKFILKNAVVMIMHKLKGSSFSALSVKIHNEICRQKRHKMFIKNSLRMAKKAQFSYYEKELLGSFSQKNDMFLMKFIVGQMKLRNKIINVVSALNERSAQLKLTSNALSYGLEKIQDQLIELEPEEIKEAVQPMAGYHSRASLFSNPSFKFHQTEFTTSFSSLLSDKYSEFELDELIREIEQARLRKRSSLSPVNTCEAQSPFNQARVASQAIRLEFKRKSLV